MGVIPKTDGSFAVKAKSVIFHEGQHSGSINILAKGKVDLYICPDSDVENYSEAELLKNSYRLFSLDQNIFLGANDLFVSNKHGFSYVASEDCILYAYMAESMEQVEALFNAKHDYSSYVLSSISSVIEHSYSVLKRLEKFIGSLSITTEKLLTFFYLLKDKHGFSHEPEFHGFKAAKQRLEQLGEEKKTLPLGFDANYFETSADKYEYCPTDEINTLKVDYYKHICNLPNNLKFSFLNADFIIAKYHCVDIANLLENIQFEIKEALQVAEQYINMLYLKNGKSILSDYLAAGLQMDKSIYDSSDMIGILNFIIDKIKEINVLYQTEYNHPLSFSIDEIQDKFERVHTALRLRDINTTHTSSVSGQAVVREGIPVELENSAEQIVAYSNISSDKASLFLNALKAFRGLKDKMSDDDQVRNLRKDLTTGYFEIYEAVLKRVTLENNQDKLFHMFLTYSYMDEKLLSPRHIWTLYELTEKDTNHAEYSVFNMKNWLQMIYNKDRNPSVNEFAMDYFDIFREMVKHGELREQDRAKYESNKDGRLRFEVANMFKTNHKLCSTHFTTYFPILYDDVIVKDLNKALVTPARVKEAIERVLKIDFSAFHREISYFNLKKGIEKEFIMQAIHPDIILMPIYGDKAVMWQEISSRMRNTPGRFLIPIFTEESLDDILIKLIGEFRWELCKTMMGVAWNDISNKSLTSEYMDYLQFFKKNKDMSEESKEKLKSQIKRFRSNSKDVFTSDYINWITYESGGAIKLNKFSREILNKYCPFNKEIRSKLSTHPTFSACAVQFANMRAKQISSIENRYAKYSRAGIALDPELIETLDFYKNL